MERIVYGDFADILKPESQWAQAAGFQTADGFWEYREPNALVLVQNGRLRVTAMPLARSHDSVRILDNAQHMYFSRERFEVPGRGDQRRDGDHRPCEAAGGRREFVRIA